jgi:uncharacterized protein YciI
MFIVSIEYQVPLKDIDAALEDHRAFLMKHFEAGHFLLSGRKVPRTGGFIIAAVESRNELERILNEDPFWRQGLASYETFEFVPTGARRDLAQLFGLNL